MDNIGFALQSLPVKDLFKVRDLEYFEGCLLAEFKSRKGGDSYLFSWVDADAEYNRWLVFRISARDLAEYLRGESTLRSLIYGSRDGFVYLVDTGADGAFSRVRLTPIEKLPSDYIPGEDSYFDGDASLFPNTHEVLTDGQWDLVDLAKFPRAYRQVYSVLYTYSPHSHSTAEVGVLVRGKPIKDGLGFAAINVHAQIDHLVPPSERPRLSAVHMSSPGVISMHLNTEVAGLVTRAVHALRKSRGEFDYLYKIIWEISHGHREVLEPEYVRHLRRLTEMLGLTWERVFNSTRDNDFLAEVLLVHFRRIEDLDRYIQTGKIQKL